MTRTISVRPVRSAFRRLRGGPRSATTIARDPAPRRGGVEGTSAFGRYVNFPRSSRLQPYVTREAVIDLLLDHPELMQRPVVFCDARALIARPAEKVLELL